MVWGTPELGTLLIVSTRCLGGDAEFVTGLVEVFSSWRDLRRDEKRDLIRAYQVRIRVSRPKRGNLSVDQVVIGVLGDRNNLTIYK